MGTGIVTTLPSGITASTEDPGTASSGSLILKVCDDVGTFLICEASGIGDMTGEIMLTVEASSCHAFNELYS